MSYSTSTIETQQRLPALFEALREQMLERGLSLFMTDEGGGELRNACPPDVLNEMLFGPEGRCRALCAEVSAEVLRTGDRAAAVDGAGLVVQASPVIERRRLVGAVTIA